MVASLLGPTGTVWGSHPPSLQPDRRARARARARDRARDRARARARYRPEVSRVRRSSRFRRTPSWATCLAKGNQARHVRRARARRFLTISPA